MINNSQKHPRRTHFMNKLASAW